MRKNTPITSQEKTFSKDEKLVSTTDLQGNIVHCNDAFVKISGFEKKGIRNFWLIKCQRCKEENLSQRII